MLLSMGLFGEFFELVWGNNFRPQMKTSPLVWVKVHHFFLSSWMGRVQGVVVNGIIWRISWKGLGKQFQTPDENLAIGMGESPSFFSFLAGWEGSRVLLSMELFGEFLGKVWENNFRPQM